VSCRFAHDDAAYVLGALTPMDRLAFEQHLRDCGRCTAAVRELAGLPGLLGRVDATALEEPSAAEPLPDTVLPRLARGVRRRRRRRTFAAVAASAAAAAVAVGVGLGAAHLQREEGVPAASPGEDGTTSPGVTRRMRPVGDVPVDASLVMEGVDWGTRLELTCTYDSGLVDYALPPAVDYVLVVRTEDGRREDVGSWRSVDGRTMRLTAGTAADPDEIASVEVRTPDGRVVLTAPS
jgi:hypothetical protein